MHVPYEMNTLHILSIFYFREGVGQTMVFSCHSLFPYERSWLHLMRTLWEQVMDGWFGDHLTYERSLSFFLTPMEEDMSCNTHLISCLRTSNILEGRTVIFLTSPS